MTRARATRAATHNRVNEWLWSWSAAPDCDWDSTSLRLIGQDDRGYWYGPSRDGRWRRLSWRNPRHVAAFLRSRHARAAVMLEATPS